MAAGGVLMLHASVSALGWVVGGSGAVVLALLDAVGLDGMLKACAGGPRSPSGRRALPTGASLGWARVWLGPPGAAVDPRRGLVLAAVLVGAAFDFLGLAVLRERPPPAHAPAGGGTRRDRRAGSARVTRL